MYLENLPTVRVASYSSFDANFDAAAEVIVRQRGKFCATALLHIRCGTHRLPVKPENFTAFVAECEIVVTA
jgi:hypothetical protein